MSDERKDKILKALPKLDPTNDDDWTGAGLPDLGRVQALTGLDDLRRDEVGKAAPGFNRTNANAAPSDMSNVGKSGGDAGPTGDNSDAPKTNAQKDGEAEKSELDEANERRAPNLDPADNPNVGKTDLGPYETQTHTADQGQYLAEEVAAELWTEGKQPTDLAQHIKDPIFLIEAAVAAFNADPRYSKNGELSQFFRHYSIAQVNIKTHQARLDKRYEAATS